MVVDRSYVERNDASRRRLEALVARLSEEDLARPVGGGWTVAVALAHIAFWDRFAVALIEGWAADGYRPLPGSGSGPINAAAAPGWRLIPPQAAAEDALAAARACDAAVATVADDLAAAILADRPRILDRSVHRGEHLEQVERALGGGRTDDERRS